MACVSVLAASANAQNLANFAQELHSIAKSSWLNLPRQNAVVELPEWFTGTPNKDDILFTNKGQPLFDEAGGWANAKQTLDLAYLEVVQARVNMRTTAGNVLVNESIIQSSFDKLTNLATALKAIIDGNFFDKRYGLNLIGGTFVAPIIRWGDLDYGIFFIQDHNVRKLEWAQDRLIVESQRMLDVAESLLLGCTEPENDDDDNCDRIADALEAIANKDFSCKFTASPLDSIGLDDLKDAIGVSAFKDGIEVPKLITKPPKGAIKPEYETLKSIPEFLAWHFKQIDALVGQFPLTIIQEDSDITTDGNQESTITLPNISEAIAEIFALNAVQLTNSEAILQLAVDGVSETILIKKMLIQCEAILNNLQEWSSIRIRQKNVKVNTTVNPKARKLDEFLASSQIDVVIDEYDPAKDGSNFDIERIGKIVNTIYAIVSSALVHRLNKDDPGVTIRDDLNKLRDGVALIDDEDEDTLDVFLDRAENGFTDTLINYNPDAVPKPYGRDRERRPLIRRTEGIATEDIKDEP